MSTTTPPPIERAENLLRQGLWQQASDIALTCLGDSQTELRARAVLANAAMQLGEHMVAVTHFQALHSALPAHAGIRSALSMALNNLGASQWQMDDKVRAEGHYREALVVDSRNPTAWFNLAALLQARRDFGAAADAYAACFAIAPAHFDAGLQAAVCQRLRGATDEARRCLGEFDLAQCTPEQALRLGMEWLQLGEQTHASAALALGSAYASASERLQMARTALDCGDVTTARDCADAARENSTDTRIQLAASLIAALAIPKVPNDIADITQARANFVRGVQDLSNTWSAQRLRQSAANLDDLAHRHLELAYYGEDDLPLASRFGDWYTRAAETLANAPAPPTPVAGRIALVSAHWMLGTVAAYFGSWIQALRDAHWEVDLIHLDQATDPQTDALAAQASCFLHLPGALDTVVCTLRERAPAIILYPEIGLSPRVHALAALRLAPTQIAAWGHPVTSGLATIDFWLSCAEMEPTNAQQHYRERLQLLPGLGTRYPMPARVSDASRVELGLPHTRHLYVVPHAAVKIHPELDTLLVRIAAADPHAAFLLFADGTPALTVRLQQRLARCFHAAGLTLADHVRWLPRATPEQFRKILAVSDVMLDAVRFSGGNTSLDAIAQGLPLVTLPGEFMRSRQSTAMLRRCGVAELIAATPDDYVATAVRVACNTEFAHDLRQRLHQGAPDLFNDAEPLGALLGWLAQLR